MRQKIIEAINKKLRIELIYHNYVRTVEPHTYGETTAGHPAIRAWQTRGGSVSNEPIGWKMFLLSDMLGVRILDESSQSPRKGYKKGDKGMRIIYCEM